MNINSALFDDFFGWLKVHKAGREHLFNQMREKYDWGYIKACEVIETELKRLIAEYHISEEQKDGDDRIAAD